MSDSFILQTYPFREADLVVSFFTRDQGKLRGVARRARRPKSSFGSGLERLSHATVSYYQKENRELVSLNSCELMQSQFALASNYESSVALDYLAEITEQLLPPNETNERHFRLLIAVLDSLHAGGNVWAAVTYFALWAVRLAGLLPELRVSADSRAIMEEMLVTPIQQLTARPWAKETARRCAARAEPLDRRSCGAQAANAGDPGGSCERRPLTFQETVLRLKQYWSDRGCIIQEPYDVEVGAGTMAPETFLRVLGPRPVSRRLRPAQPPPRRRPLWRKSEPPLQAPAVAGDPEALARRRDRSVSRQPARPSASTLASTTSSSKKTTGKRRRWAPGASAGR